MISQKPVCILGAGPAGIAAAYYLTQRDKPVVVLEKEPQVGGLSTTLKIKDYMVDYGPHSFHLKQSQVTDLFNDFVGAQSLRVTRKVRLFIANRILSFPLDPVEAFFHFSPLLTLRIIFSYLNTCLFNRKLDPFYSFESFGVRNFGRVLYKLAFGDYSEKVWGMAGNDLSAKLAQQKLLTLDIKKIIMSTLGLLREDKRDTLGLDKKRAYDAYPEKGIGIFYEKMADAIRKRSGSIVLNATIRKIHVQDHRVISIEFLDNGQLKVQECSGIISSIPISSLMKYFDDNRTRDVKEHATFLKYRDLIEIYVVVDKDYFSDWHWIYLVDPRFTSARLSEQKNLNKNSCPENLTVLSFDITCNKNDYLWRAQDAFLINLAMQDLREMNVHPRTVIDGFVLRAEDAYPVYLRGFEEHIRKVTDFFSEFKNFYSTGRQGLYLNNDMHDSMELGFLASMALLKGDSPETWHKSTAAQYVTDRLEGVKRDPIKFNA